MPVNFAICDARASAGYGQVNHKKSDGLPGVCNTWIRSERTPGIDLSASANVGYYSYNDSYQ